MKKYLFFQQIFCCGFTMPLFLISLSIFAQKDIITYPVEGSIFQKDINNNATINIAGQIETTSTLYYKITQKRGSGCGSCGTEQTINNANITAWNMGRKGFHLSLGSLPKGWYSVQLYRKRGFWIFKQNVNLNSKEFGIGDVYFIAGQSNAAGYIGTTDPNSPNDDNPNPFLNNFTQNESARVYKVSSDFGNNSTVSKGLPYFKENQSTPNKFEIFRNGTNKVTDPMPIYPNGSASWCWSSLAKKISDGGTPVMFFNLAYAGSSVNQDWATSQTSPLMYKFSKTLKMYGNVLGAKAVLWHQGERDSQILTLSSTNQTNYLNSYETGLSDIINWSRQALKDDITKNLNWYISKASFTTGPSVDGGFGIGPNRTNPGIFSSNPNCLPTDNGYTTQKEKNNNLISKQINLYNSANRIFQGVDTDDDEECDRATNWRIHFSGNTLEDLATEWKQAIDNSNTNNSISPTPLIKLEQVSVNGSAYTLTVTELSPPPVPEINTYYWVKNDAGIDNAVASTNNNSYTFSSTSSDDFLTCYIKNGSGRLFACQPFIVPGGTFDGKSIVVSNPSLTFSSGSNESKEVTVISTNVEWDLTSVPSWVNVDINENDSKVTFTTNSSTNVERNQRVYYQETNGISSYTDLTQLAGSSCSQTNLTSLTPTNPSGEWQGYGTRQLNKSIDGNTLMVGGYQTGNGIGTHANSTMVYNLSGQYGTFSGSVGRDDEADNCGCGNMKLQFIIKADGATLFTSSLLGTTDARQAFSVSVSGKNTLELIVNDGGDNFYGDHADWLDPVLYCGAAPSCTTAPPAPTNVSSSPATISSGGSSTLSATCAAGTVTWSTGAVGNSISVSPTVSTNYSVSCVSGSCPPSNTVSVGVTVSTGACSAISDGLVMGTWNATGQQLVARFFNGQFWLTQRTGTNPDGFVVRGSGMLQRSDVSLANGSYYNLVGCFGWTYSNYDNLGNPPSSVFSTPAGYSLGYAQDGTMFYTATTGGGGGGSCTDAYVSNAWASATIGYGSTPQIGYRFDGGAMVMGSTTYTQGIGTHAGSEIIYNFTNNPYANFKASVGRDVDANGCNCPAGSGQTIVFKVYDNTTGALISSTNNPVTKGINQGASDMVVPIAGISSIRLVVEDGGDQIWGDHANWGNARFTCVNSNGRESVETAEEWFWVSPNPNNGKFVAKVILKSKQSVQLYLSNIQGNIINEYSFVGVEGENSFEINISNIQDQIYNLRCQVGEESSSKRVVIEK